MKTEAATHRCLKPFRWESLHGWDFRPHLIVVSGLFGGNPFMDGILGHNLLLSQTFFHDLIFLSRWNSGYQEALFTNFFLFSRWNSGCQEAFLTNFFLFSRWNSGYQEAFSHDHFFFHDGILSIRKPFSRLFFFHDGIRAIRKPFLTNFSFFTMEFSKYAIWGKTLYIYITKSIYTGSASLKTLPLNLEPPLQGKEYGPPYSNASKKRKANVFSRNHL
jgi:hypothetical protein